MICARQRRARAGGCWAGFAWLEMTGRRSLTSCIGYDNLGEGKTTETPQFSPRLPLAIALRRGAAAFSASYAPGAARRSRSRYISGTTCIRSVTHGPRRFFVRLRHDERLEKSHQRGAIPFRFPRGARWREKEMILETGEGQRALQISARIWSEDGPSWTKLKRVNMSSRSATKKHMRRVIDGPVALRCSTN